MKRFEVAVVGEIFNDHIFTGFAEWPQPGEEVFAENYTREIGGGAGITACSLAKLGRKVAIVAVVGSKDDWSRHRLESFGVSLDGMKASSQETAVTVSVSTRGDRSFFTWAGANRELPLHLLNPEVQEILLASRHIHFAMRLERDIARNLLPRVRGAGCTTSIDPGFHSEWYKLSGNRQSMSECDYFFPNEKEGELLVGSRDPREVLEVLHQSGIMGTVLKLGSRGAASILNGQLIIAVPPAINAVDTTGAGDAFNAGFIDAVLDSSAQEEAMRRGCACGALSTLAAGGIAALPDRREVEIMEAQVKIGDSYGK